MAPHHDPPPPKTKRPCSEAQLRANRANAQMSTGPRTPEGKARACLNNYQHGGRSKTGTVPNGSNPPPGELTVGAEGWDGREPNNSRRLAKFRRRYLVTQVSSWQT